MSRPTRLQGRPSLRALLAFGGTMAVLASGCGLAADEPAPGSEGLTIQTAQPANTDPAAGNTAAATLGADPTVESSTVTARAKIDPAIEAALARGEAPNVIVLLDEGESLLARAEMEHLTGEGSTFMIDHVARSLDTQKSRLWARVPLPHVTPLKTYRNLPADFVRIHAADALTALAAAPEVSRIVMDTTYDLMTDANLTLINQPQAAAAGKLGANTAVAVLDTGTNYLQSTFGCTSPGVPAGCKVAYAADFAPNDNALDDNGHGTNVAGIILAVAPSTKILALDVFSGAGAASSDILAAINWSIANRTTYNIVSMNLSLGSGTYTAACPNDVFASALASARAAGIVPVVASGNAAATNAISSPACVPAAVSVGAVYAANIGGLKGSNCSDTTSAADKVACFSNSASFLTMLAPGVMITAAGITESGTSQATPHVAGAVAVLRSAFPAETADFTVSRLTSTGVAVKDARNNITKPRLNLNAALGAPAAKPGPVGTVKINTGAASTKTTAVTLTLATTSGTPSQVCISNSSTCTAWVATAASKAWTLDAGDGVKTVYVWWKDAATNVSASAATATIKMDTTAPVGGSMQGTATGTSLKLTWSGFSDAVSGLASYKLVGGTASPASACASGTSLYAGTGLTATVTMTKGKTNYFRLCAIDAAGNVSAGILATVSGV